MFALSFGSKFHPWIMQRLVNALAAKLHEKKMNAHLSNGSEAAVSMTSWASVTGYTWGWSPMKLFQKKKMGMLHLKLIKN